MRSLNRLLHHTHPPLSHTTHPSPQPLSQLVLSTLSPPSESAIRCGTFTLARHLCHPSSHSVLRLYLSAASLHSILTLSPLLCVLRHSKGYVLDPRAIRAILHVGVLGRPVHTLI